MKKPLKGVSILELSTMIAGPYAGQLLGDLGADVVKIERPSGGELARSLKPKVGGESFYYITANRNKRSLALDVTTDEGSNLLLELADDADVVLTNFPPTFAEQYGIDRATVRDRNPELIYCAISAYGSTGPYSEDAGIDTTIQATSGAMSMTRTEETPPMRSGMPMNDVFGALYAVQGILTALLARERTGEGEFIDVGLLDAGIAGMTTRAMYSLVTNKAYPPFGRRHNYFAPEGSYEVSDGYVQLSVVTDRHWRLFCQAIDSPELAADERFEEVNRRVSNRQELDEYLVPLLREWEAERLVATLREHDVPAAHVRDTLSVWDHPQVQARDMRLSLDHPDAGTVDTLGFPVKYENIDPGLDRHPPRLGEHTKEVLRSMGYTKRETDRLQESGIIATRD